MSEITFFAKTNFRNQEAVFGIKTDDRRRHIYAIGKTGMGKTNLLEHLVIQDIRNGHGVCYVDPHGDTAKKILKAVPANRINDVIYFNPSDSQYPIAFNILEAVDEDKKNLVTSGMMGVFKKIWPDVWSARMEYILNNTILALLDYPGSTMLGVNRMMSDKDFRKKVYPNIKDPVVKAFWLNEFEAWEDRFRKEAVAAIQNKVGQFISSSVIRNIVGQPKSTIDMREIMDNQKILIVDLSKGKIGEDSMRLLGGMIITKIQLAAMGRVDTPEEERKDFYLHVDEFQNFATEAFANILSEARKYRLSLTLAHQYINQLTFDSNTTVRDAVFGNVGTLIVFRVGAEDAEHLEKEFEPIFMLNDIVNLPKYKVYLKLMIDGVAGDAFSATILPPLDLSDTEGNEEKIINVSRERYANDKAEVEDKIARWSGMATYEKIEKIEKLVSERAFAGASKSSFAPVKKSSVSGPSGASSRTAAESNDTAIQKENTAPVTANSEQAVAVTPKPDVTLYDAVCDTCEAKIQVPFKPDGKRPTFCKDCLKEYQRIMAKAKENQHVSAPPQNQGEITRSVPKSVPRQPDARTRTSQKTYEHKAFVPQDSPLTLSQMQHVAPKKFKHSRKRPDLGAVRNLVKRDN